VEEQLAIERVEYQAGKVVGRGALVWNEKIDGERPLLLIMPNWLGVTDAAIARAGRMAGDKYVAFVGCMYGEGKTCDGPPTSKEWAEEVASDPIERRKRVNAALETLVAEAGKRGIGDASKKAAVGFCFGGANVLELARSGADIDAAVCIHGDLAGSLPAKKGDIKAPLFILHGSKDPIAPKADRDALEAELDAAEAKWQMLNFGGLLHAFAEEDVNVPGIGVYDPAAARQTYRMLDDFIPDAFAKRL
jgi:dienelactone hydrolase